MKSFDKSIIIFIEHKNVPKKGILHYPPMSAPKIRLTQ